MLKLPNSKKMEEEGRATNETTGRGTDWEVVSLTASAYAAAPGPQAFDPSVKHQKECSEALFMSKHFAAPPHYEPKNLPTETYCNIQYESIAEPQKCSNDNSKMSLQYEFDYSMNNLGAGKQERDLKMVEEVHAIIVSPNYISFDDKSSIHGDISSISEAISPSNMGKFDCKPAEEDNSDSFDGSPDSWWKKRAISVYNHTKGTNTFWSIFVVVAVTGLVILGQRWRRDKSQLQQFKWRFAGSDERINSMAGPVSRLKLLLGGNRLDGLVRDGLRSTF